MKKLFIFSFLSLISLQCFCWGFYAHKKINYYAVFLLPPEMMVLYKANIDFITEHAVDPDKRRYAVPVEGPEWRCHSGFLRPCLATSGSRHFLANVTRMPTGGAA